MSESDQDDRPGRKERIRKAVDYGMTHDLSERHVEVDLEPVHASQEIMVGRGLRLPVELDAEIRRIAAARGVAPSALMRQWIEAGVAGERADAAVVPLAELQKAISRLSRLVTT